MTLTAPPLATHSTTEARSSVEYAVAVRALAETAPSAHLASRLSDDDLLATTKIAAEALRHSQHTVAVLAAEVARRSAPELGQRGLAQRTGPSPRRGRTPRRSPHRSQRGIRLRRLPHHP